MIKAIPLTLTAFLTLSLPISVLHAQETQKPAPVSDERSSAQLNSSAQNSTPTENTSAKGEPAANDLNAEARKQYDSAIALSEAGRFDEAILAFKQSLKIRPDDPLTNFGLGMTYAKSKSYKEAFDSFKRAARLRPDWPEAHFRLGMMSYVIGKKDEATAEYKALVRLNSPLATTLSRMIADPTPTGRPAPSEASKSNGEGAKSTPTTAETVKPSPGPSPGTTSGSENPGSAVKNPNTGSMSSTDPPPKSSDPPANTNPVEAPTPTPTTTVAPRPLSDIYRVGVGDVLDIRFLNSTNSRSTLFTVVSGGVIDMPVVGGPLMVAGLTTDEIQTRIASELKRRAVEEGAQVSVGVRQYGSHSVVISGLVVSPGARYLRREAVPLYVLLAESQLRNDAARVSILRGGATGPPLDLSDPATMNITVMAGDVVSISSLPQEFYYIAGRINNPGQKTFQKGITLLQAVLAAGGTPKNETIIEISRDGVEGRLVTTKFNLKEIKAGKVEDPKIQPGDRIQVLK